MGPKVVIAHPYRQHSPQLVFALYREGMLKKYFTSLGPRFSPFFHTINPNLVETFTRSQIFRFLMLKISKKESLQIRLTHWINRHFDFLVARKLKEMEFDLFIGYETSSLECFKVCKEKKAICILDLASVYWKLQKRIFEEEKLLGNSIIGIDRGLFKKINEIKEKEIQLADLIFAGSHLVKKSLMEANVKEEKIFIIPYGVDLNLFTPKKEYRKEGKFNLLFVGQISLRKGLKYLLEAYRQLNLSNSELLLIGNVASNSLKVLSKYKGLFKHIPFLPQRFLVQYYQDADVFVLPSLIEGFALVVLEAMAAGTPVIVTDYIGSNDVVRDNINGFVIPIRSIEKLKEKILFFYENRQKIEEFGRNARKQAENYSWEKYYQNIKDVVIKIDNLKSK